MNETSVMSHTSFVIPPSVVSRVDVARLLSEAERVDNELTTAIVRAKAGAEQYIQPVLSQQLIDFLTTNNISLEKSTDRSELIKQLRLLKNEIPIVHMTFATTADSESLSSLAAWLRKQVHPQAVIAVGIQPDLVGGVHLRTANHVYDFSIRKLLEGKRDLITEGLRAQ